MTTPLKNKILSFNPQYYVTLGTHDNSGVYTNSPLNIGTGGTNISFSLSNEAPVPFNEFSLPNDGPDNYGCWQWNIGANGDTTATRWRTTQLNLTQWKQLENGENLPDTYSTGMWFKFTSPLAALAQNNPATIIYEDYHAGMGLEVQLAGGASNAANKGKLLIAVTGGGVGGTNFGSTESASRVDDGAWHYLNINSNRTANNFFNFEVFLDGVSLGGRTGVNVSSPNTIFRQSVGTTVGSANMGNAAMRVAHIYTKSVMLTSSQIQEIWQSTQGGTNVSISETPATASALSVLPTVTPQTNTNIQETPATASALMTDPTIIITSPNYTFVQTQIIVSAELLTNISVSASQNLNYTLATTFNASVELLDNINIQSGSNESFGAEEFTAFAELLEPKVAESPMTASALFPNSGLSVTPNYRQLVKELNPSLYIGSPYLIDPNQSLVPEFYNDGNDNWGTKFVDSGVRTNLGPSPMDAIGTGNSFRFISSGNNAARQFGYIDSNAITQGNYFINDGNGANDFTIEFWINFTSVTDSSNPIVALDFGNGSSVRLDNTTIRFKLQGQDIANDGRNNEYVHISTFVSTLNSWNHFVITGNHETDGILTTTIWYNGAPAIRQSPLSPPAGAPSWAYVPTSNNLPGYKVDPATTISQGLTVNNGGNSTFLINHIALYKSILTNSQIGNHYNFISTASPNKIIYDDAREVSAESGDHNFVVTSNAYYDADPITVTALIVQPTLIVGVSIDVPVSPHTASAQLPMPSLKLDVTITETPTTVNAELLNPFVLSNLYYQYVQTNIIPYRYVSFDAANPYADYGTDTDYAVAPTVVNGTIVGPGEAINGKSAKTAGNNYATDGVILKESEHDDNWGTGNASWHSSFWFERAPEDTSTGLRVLWNVNGAYDNQYAVLYHYQNKLHYQINNQVGAPITITSPNNVNIFDFDRHFVVIESHHNNNKNHVYVYVDSVLVLDQDLNTYAITTINNPIHVGANSEANNFPRLGVGCLITPFAFTTLPVVPTNTILYIDEIYWDKNDIDQTGINGLFNIMPDQNNNNSAADPMLADVLSVNPAVSTEVIFNAGTMNANAEFVNPTVIAQLNLVTSALPMEASALLMPGEVFEDRQLFADVMFANATFNNAGVIISFPALPMTASAKFPTEIFFSDGVGDIYLDGVYPAYVRHIRADSFDLVSIPRRLEQI